MVSAKHPKFGPSQRFLKGVGALTLALIFALGLGRSSPPQNGKVVRRAGWGRGGYSREWRNGLPSGLWQDFFSNGKLRTEKVFFSGTPTGIWKAWRSDGTLESEEGYASGLLHGDQKAWYATGRLAFSGRYDRGRKDGTFSEFSPEGFLGSEERFVRGVKEGVQKTFHPNRNLAFTGSFHEGKREGIFVTYTLNGAPEEAVMYRQDLLDGCAVRWKNGSKISEGYYRAGGKTGAWKGWYPDGVLAFTGTFHEGKKNGVFSTFDALGNLVELSSFLDDQLHGLQEVWRNGRRVSSGRYQRGVKTGVWRGWHPDGTLAFTGSFEAGKREGLWKLWDEKGRPLSEGSYENDREYGFWRRWHANGKLALSGHYEKGKAEGIHREWNEAGYLISRIQWRGGKAIPETEELLPIEDESLQ